MPRPRKAAPAEATALVPAPTQELVPAASAGVLPGEAEVDEATVNAAVAELNRLYSAKGLETARVMGEYVLQTFFDGKPENFHEKGKKHVSFRKLADREDLLPSYSSLWNACSVVEQLRLLPPDLVNQLPLSHHKLLLPVRDPEAKAELARKAVEAHLGKREFEEEVKRLREKENEEREATGKRQAGRPPLPAFVKGLTKLRSAVALATSAPVEADDFSTYSPTDAEALLVELDEQLSALSELKERVQQGIRAWRKQMEAP